MPADLMIWNFLLEHKEFVTTRVYHVKGLHKKEGFNGVVQPGETKLDILVIQYHIEEVGNFIGHIIHF